MIPNSTSTKEKILGFIKANNQMSVTQLAEQLKITEMAVRRHIQVLETDGLLQSVMKKNLTGRPAKVYQISEYGEEFFPQHYKQIAIDLLQEINQLDPVIINKAIISRQQRLINRYRSRLERKSFNVMIAELVKIQTELGFMAEESESKLEELSEIKQFNCPYIDIAKDFPEICRVEHQFFIDLLQTKRVEKISSMSLGDSCCHYVIGKN